MASQELRGTKDEVEEQIDSIANKIAGAHRSILCCLCLMQTCCTCAQGAPRVVVPCMCPPYMPSLHEFALKHSATAVFA